MKKIKESFKELLGAIWVLFIMIPDLFVLPIIILFAYLIAVSDLPDWFKFFLLR
jgi:hypothetical protein